MPCVLASVRPVVGPAPLPRRAVAVFSVAGLALASMAVGLGLAFPGGIGSRSGQGAGVTPILVTPARQAQPAVTAPASVSVLANEPSSVPAVTPSSAPSHPTVPSTAAPSPTTTVPPDVINQVNQTVTDVLGTLFPSNGGSK